MKDAKGHGSEARGAHQEGVHAATLPASPHEGQAGEFVHAGRANLAEQGFKPAKRAQGGDMTGALRVGWGYAQQTGQPATVTHTGRMHLTIVKKGLKIPYGQSHMVVHPNGEVHNYHRKPFE